MEDYFKNSSIFKHSILGYDLNSITDLVIDLYNKNGNKNEDTISNIDYQISYKLKNDIFIISFNDINYKIEKNPFLFYHKKNVLLGKTYSYEIFEKFIKSIFDKFDVYNDNNKELKSKEDILNNPSRKFILKEKNKFSLEIFNLLNFKRDFIPNEINNIIIPQSQLSPIPSKEFYLNNKNINIVLEHRNKFLMIIKEFMENWNEKIFIIYGCDGIGKTVTFIYLSNLFNKFKVLYFNLKIIMSDKKESYDLFTFEIMRYFTICNKQEQNIKNIKDFNYKQYLNELNNINKSNFNFWKELINFVKSKSCEEETLLIIDQFKDIYEEDQDFNLNQLKYIILNEITSFKLLISFSVNNSNTKNKLMEDFKYCSYESPINISYSQKKEINNTDTFEKIFENIDLNENKNYKDDQDDGNFLHIYLFNGSDEQKENKNKEIKENKSDYDIKNINSIVDTNINDINNMDKSFETNKLNKIKIIYINQMISLKNLGEIDILKYFDIFDFNPKYYVKFLKFISDFPYNSLDILFKKFLENTYNHIHKKLMKYYNETQSNNLINESIIELLKLKDLVDNKIKFTTPILIKYIKEYPIKYIKIKIYNKTNETEDNYIQNIIDLNNQFKDTEFYFEYCFPFFGLILSKIIYMNENYYSINYDNLSGSAQGSYIEQKIKRTFIYEKYFFENIKLRYVWNFTSLNNDISKNINQIDYENFEKIKYDENEKNLNLPFSVCYIVPGSQNNKNIDSALLIPNLNDKIFKLVTFQIKHGKDLEIRSKKEYIKYSFLTKKKFEMLYNIQISNVYFYFILTNEFKNDNNIKNLKDKNISYLLFSLREHILFIKENKKLSLNDLINTNAEILEIENNNEEERLNNKIELIKKFEIFLKKKRFNGIKITRNIYENGRKIIFNKDKGLRLSNTQRQNIINLLKTEFKIKYDFTIKYVFNIKINEVFNLTSNLDLFGVFYYKNNIYIIYKIFIIQIDEIINNKNLHINKNINNEYNYVNVYNYMKIINENEKNIRFQFPDKCIKIDEIKNENYIYIFKIYYINKH